MMPSINAVKVMLADAHHLFREGLRAALEADQIVVLGETADTRAAALTARALRPDVVVLGCNEASGVEAVREISSAIPDVRIVVVSASSAEHDVIEALAAGACGHLHKDMPPEDLVRGIRQAATGGAVLSAEAMRALMAHVRADGRSPGEREVTLSSFTARELEVLTLIADGADNAAIGRQLSISPHTVKHYVTNILEKLEVHSRIEAAVRAVRDGLI